MGRVGCAQAPGRPAEWTFVVGRAFLVAVPIGTSPRILAPLAALVAAPRVELESVVALLPLSGEQAVESFVVVVPGEPTDGDGIPVSAVVRGDVAADVFSVGGSRRFTDRGIRPWLLADFQSVTGIVIGSPAHDVVPPALLNSGAPVGVGAVAGHALFWSASGELAEAREPERAADTIIAPAPLGQADADTILRPPPVAQDTVILRRRHQPDEREAAGREPRAPLPEIARCGFRLPDGREQRLDEVCYLGRRPRPPRIANGPSPRLVTVHSRSSAVSGTHLEIRQVGDSVVVTDLGSTNGTIVAAVHGRRRRLGAGQSLAVLPGTTVDIGDGNIIEILPASDR